MWVCVFMSGQIVSACGKFVGRARIFWVGGMFAIQFIDIYMYT